MCYPYRLCFLLKTLSSSVACGICHLGTQEVYLLLANVTLLHHFLFKHMRKPILLQSSPMMLFSVSSCGKKILMLLNKTMLELLIRIVLVGILAQRIRNCLKFFATLLSDAATENYSSES